MYKKVPTDQQFAQRELAVLDFWNTNDIFNKSIAQSVGKPSFSFYDGPPTANGKPHIGHIHTRAIKDLIPRYKTMKGYNVLRKAGWDTHGLPVELEVEKELGIYGKGKGEIEKYGVEAFIQKCKESVWKYEQEWKEVSQRVGFWLDMNNPYITYDNTFIESVWWALREIWNKDLIYKGHKVLPYCSRCGTGLSSHEVAQGYKDIKEDSVVAKFKVVGEMNTYLLAWTTTPWTLPSNVGLCVNAVEDYAYVSHEGETYILAQALVSKHFGESAKIVKTVKGQDLEYLAYERLLDFASVEEKAFFVTCDNYVTLTDGTGIVHTAPAFGEDDARVARKYGLPMLQLVNEQGQFDERVTPWVGQFVKDADPLIIERLQSENKVFKVIHTEHSYPHCWRCDTPLLYYAKTAWYIEMTKLRGDLVANNSTVNWMPENVKQGRFGNFLENVIDWGLSRERYWGTPLPIWECSSETCDHKHLIGSVAELSERTGQDQSNLELHKPYVDHIHFACDNCGSLMNRVPDVIDCWFDSGAMAFAQFHYPFENQDLFDQNYPADFISEAIDQTRGWFYSQMAISTAVFGRSPYQNVIVLGHTLDKDGKKMSKSRGNAVSPIEAMDKFGADAIRWFYYVGSSPWLNSRFSDEAVSEYQNKFMGTLWNTYAFYVLYANIDSFDPTQHHLDSDSLSQMDKWILSKLEHLVETLNTGMDQFRVYESANALTVFVDNLSNWYIRRCRERFWVSGMAQDKINAYMTLYTVLKTVTLLSAPFIPFMSEEIYQNLVRSVDQTAPESVHLCEYPISPDQFFVDTNLEQHMDLVYSISVLGRTARNTGNLKNRQPLAHIYVQASNAINMDDSLTQVIKEELNIKNLTWVADTTQYVSYSYKSNLPTLGPKYGKLMGKISGWLKTAPASLYAELKAGDVQVELDGETITLTLDDVQVKVENTNGYVTETNRDISVVLDTTLTPELIEEGRVRELVSKVQNMRKNYDGLQVTDRIELFYQGNDLLATIIEANKANIQVETLSVSVIAGSHKDMQDWNINGEKIQLGIKKA